MNTEEAEVERFYEDLQHLLELTPPKDVLFIIGNWNEKPLQYSCLENPMKRMRRQKYMTLKDELPGWQVPNMLLEISGEKTPE